MNLRNKLENLMVAITFAEAGNSETARETLKKEKYAEKVDRVPARKVVLQRKELRAPSFHG